MRLELFVALRYLRAKRKQAVVSIITLISVIGVGAGVTALIIALALNTGMQQEFQERILGATSHVNLLGATGASVPAFSDLLIRVSELPEIVSATATIYGQCLLQNGRRQQPAIMKGILKEDVAEVVPTVVDGELSEFAVSKEFQPIILGRDLAEGLAVSAGEYVRAFGLKGELSPIGRMPRIQTFQVVAIFESGLWDYDANWALIPVSSAQKFFGFGHDEVSTIELRIQDLYAAPQVAEKVRNLAGPGFTTSTWIELNRPLFSALRLEKLAMFVAIGLIVLVASLNIISTLTLMVMEKSRDIAILTAMGGTPSTLTRVFMLQGVIIGLVGTLLGDGVGILSVWYLDTYKVFHLQPEVYSIPYVPFRWTVLDLLLVSAAAVLISFLATLYPARAAARLNPVEALRYE